VALNSGVRSLCHRVRGQIVLREFGGRLISSAYF